jgi:hypothetical protein
MESITIGRERGTWNTERISATSWRSFRSLILVPDIAKIATVADTGAVQTLRVFRN